MKKTAILLTIFITISSVSFAHPGRTDSNGGHYNRSTGEYHYHDGSSSGSYSFSDTTTETTNSYTYDDWKNEQKIKKYDELERQVNQYKEELEEAGYNSITDISSKLQEKESEISNLWSLFIAIFIIGIAIAYNIGLNKKANTK